MSDALDKLIEAVEDGTFLMDVFPDGRTEHIAYEAFSGFLDAALSLHEALLPGYGWGAGSWGARVWLYSDHPKWDGSERHEVDMVNAPARAWLIAILRAYRAAQREA